MAAEYAEHFLGAMAGEQKSEHNPQKQIGLTLKFRKEFQRVSSGMDCGPLLREPLEQYSSNWQLAKQNSN